MYYNYIDSSINTYIAGEDAHALQEYSKCDCNAILQKRLMETQRDHVRW